MLFYGRGVSIRWRFYASGQETSASRTRRAPSCTGRPLRSGRKIGHEQEGRKQVLYLLATQWIPFWGSDGIPSMGIFTTEGGRNWGWRKTVGKQINTKTATWVFSTRRKMHKCTVEEPPFSSHPDQVLRAAVNTGAHRGTTAQLPTVLQPRIQAGIQPGVSLQRI